MDIIRRGGGYPGVSPPLPPPVYRTVGRAGKEFLGVLVVSIKIADSNFFWKRKMNLRKTSSEKFSKRFFCF